MDLQMERMMRMHNPDFKGGLKVLEPNANHPLIKTLNERLEGGEFDGSDKFAKLILDSALYRMVRQISDPGESSRRSALRMSCNRRQRPDNHLQTN